MTDTLYYCCLYFAPVYKFSMCKQLINVVSYLACCLPLCSSPFIFNLHQIHTQGMIVTTSSTISIPTRAPRAATVLDNCYVFLLDMHVMGIISVPLIRIGLQLTSWVSTLCVLYSVLVAVTVVVALLLIVSCSGSGGICLESILRSDACTEVVSSWSAACLITLLYSKFIIKIYTLIVLEATC